MKKKDLPKLLYLSLDTAEEGRHAYVLSDHCMLVKGEDVAVYELKKVGKVVEKE